MGTAEQTAPARDRQRSQEGERGAEMMDCPSRLSVGDRLPRWICIRPELGKMEADGGNG